MNNTRPERLYKTASGRLFLRAMDKRALFSSHFRYTLDRIRFSYYNKYNCTKGANLMRKILVILCVMLILFPIGTVHAEHTPIERNILLDNAFVMS